MAQSEGEFGPDPNQSVEGNRARRRGQLHGVSKSTMDIIDWRSHNQSNFDNEWRGQSWSVFISPTLLTCHDAIVF